MKPIICKYCKAVDKHHSFQCYNKPKLDVVSKPKQKAIKPISDKQSKLLKKYRKVRDEFMGKNKFCQFEGCNKASEDLHHMKSRKYHLCDVEFFMAVCRTHHTWIHNNSGQSYELGYLIKSI